MRRLSTLLSIQRNPSFGGKFVKKLETYCLPEAGKRIRLSGKYKELTEKIIKSIEEIGRVQIYRIF